MWSVYATIAQNAGGFRSFVFNSSFTRASFIRIHCIHNARVLSYTFTTQTQLHHRFIIVYIVTRMNNPFGFPNVPGPGQFGDVDNNDVGALIRRLLALADNADAWAQYQLNPQPAPAQNDMNAHRFVVSLFFIMPRFTNSLSSSSRFNVDHYNQGLPHAGVQFQQAHFGMNANRYVVSLFFFSITFQ